MVDANALDRPVTLSPVTHNTDSTSIYADLDTSRDDIGDVCQSQNVLYDHVSHLRPCAHIASRSHVMT